MKDYKVDYFDSFYIKGPTKYFSTEKDGKVGTTDYDYITDVVVKAACNKGISWSDAICVLKILDKSAYEYMKDIETWVVGQPKLDDFE